MAEAGLRSSIRFAFVIVSVSVFVFVIARLMPGDVLTNAWAGRDPTQKELQAERERLGLTKPLYEQYAVWAGNVLRGDFGRSLVTRRPVSQELRQRLPVTAELAVAGTFLSAVVGISLGLAGAVKRHSIVDHLTRSMAMLGISLPSFLIASIVLLLLSKYLHWIPPQRYESIVDSPRNNFQQFIFPSLILGFWGAAAVMRMTRTAVLDVIQLDYVRTAYAKGLSGKVVVWRHVLRNAWPPIIVVLGLVFAQLLSGTVVLEIIFGLPGIGSYVVDATNARDYSAVQAVALFMSVAVIVANAAADMAVSIADPRTGR